MAAAADIPAENQNKPALESLGSYDAEALVKVLNGEGDDAAIDSLFFSADAFNQVKGIADPAAYFKQLIKWFHNDVTKERSRLKEGAPWTVDGFKRGGCKWKEKGTEANALPYWSCYKNKVLVKNAKGQHETVEVRAIINWGPHWYITHLGAIPKG